LNITDSNIYVQNVNALTPPNVVEVNPGVIFINGEKIVFWGIDYVNNVLTQIRRAVDGTGAPTVHTIGTTVADTNTYELIPGGNAVNTTTWLNPSPGAAKYILMTDQSQNQYDWADNLGDLVETYGSSANTTTDGTGLKGSTTAQAVFLKTLT
jgi:hypothetical protein